jgi:ribonuclease P protein component
MLVSQYRLRSSLAIEQVLEAGRYVRTPFFTLKYLAMSKADTTRIAIIVGKKALKRAVDRNRAKRRLRAGLQPLVTQIKSGYHLVFILNSQIIDTNHQQVDLQINQALTKINLLSSNNRLTI